MVGSLTPAPHALSPQLTPHAAHGGDRRRLACCWWLTTCAIVCLARPAEAQRLDLGAFAPTPQPTVTFTVPEPVPQGHGTFHFGLTSDVSTGLLHRSTLCGAQQPADAACSTSSELAQAAVPWQLRGALLFELSLFDLVSIGASVPLAVSRSQLDDAEAETHGGLGDVGLTFAGALVRSGLTQLGWQLAASLPTAAQETFAGERTVTITPALALSHALGRVTLVAQVGYHLRKRQLIYGVDRDDDVLAKVGARFTFNPTLAALGEVRVQIGTGSQRTARPESLAEIDLGVRFGSLRSAALDLGFGTGAWPAYRALGAPDFRVFLILRRALGPAGCATGPEDYDGFQDADGCGDPDNDADGIPDTRDACPNDAEDWDGFQDGDGCPEMDNDADGLPDNRDLCPEYSEDFDGFQDLDGCPEPDNDEDGVADGNDRCRLDPEDRDGFEDEDGCPEPGPAQPTVTRAGSRLLISDRVYFEDESDTLRAVSAPLLDALAATFKELPGRPRLRVEGHTDDSGNAQYNLDLSYRRARAVVEYLKRQGIDPDRLEYVGHGSGDPLGPNDRPEGRALNRRVEFVLLGN